MKSFDTGIPNEILFVKCQYSSDPVHSHRSHKSCIVNLNSRDIVRDEQRTPLSVNRQTIRKQLQLVLKKPGPAVGFLRREPVPVPIKWTRTRIPELCHVLRRVAEHSTTLKNYFDCRYDERIIPPIWLYPTKKNVAINEVWSSCHLRAVLVEAFPREALGPQVRQSLGANC